MNGVGTRVVAVASPGRFPTTVHDPGGWWPVLAGEGYRLERWSANAAWWRALCSAAGVAAVLGPGVPALSLRPIARPTGPVTTGGIVAPAGTLGELASAAGVALEALRSPAIFGDGDRYADAVGTLARYLHELDTVTTGLRFTFPGGAELDLEYADSATLVAAARSDGPLIRLVDLAADSYPGRLGDAATDLLVCSVTTPQDLLLTLAVIERLRRRGHRVHACLADHGYENFTLRPHLERLRTSRTLDTVFDSIVEVSGDRDLIVPALARALAAGVEVDGFLDADDPRLRPFLVASAPPAARSGPGPAPRLVPPPVPTFAPEPVLVTRISQRRCYWARCTFCIHNVRFVDRAAPSTLEIPAAVASLERWLEAGYRVVTLNDEALSPAMLDALCAELERRDVVARYPDFRWIARSKLEKAHRPELFERLRRAGCVELLFGLESGSERVRRLMDKHVPGLDRERILAIVRAATAAGIGVHLNMIAGFPGETVEELEDTIDLVAEALDGAPGGSWILNRFVVFPATPVADQPERYDIELVPAPGDMPAILAFRATGWWALEAGAIEAAIPGLEAMLEARLGLDTPGTVGERASRWLLFGTGHGTIAKARGLDLLRTRSARAAVA